MRKRFVNELLREQRRSFEEQLAKKDEQIQSLLDRIQHPERTPLWREPPPPLEEFEDQLIYQTDASEWEGE